MSSLGNGYTHWRGASTGVWERRHVITQYGIRLCLKSWLLRALLILSWSLALGLIGFYFLFGQLLMPEGGLLAFNLSEDKLQKILSGITAWMLLYPEICVDGLYRISFYAISDIYGSLSFFAIILFIPKLIANDLSSQAIIIYNSKALTRFDYMLGKFGVVFSILCLLWVVPILAAWLMGNFLSPDLSFFYHSFPALLRALLVTLITVVSLSLLAMAISALAKKSSVAIVLWIFVWIFSGVIANTSSQVKYISLHNCLHDISNHIYALDSFFENAESMLPFFSTTMGPALSRGFPLGKSEGLFAPSMFLIGFCVVAIVILLKRIKPE